MIKAKIFKNCISAKIQSLGNTFGCIFLISYFEKYKIKKNTINKIYTGEYQKPLRVYIIYGIMEKYDLSDFAILWTQYGTKR